MGVALGNAMDLMKPSNIVDRVLLGIELIIKTVVKEIFKWLFKAETGIVELLRTTMLGLMPKLDKSKLDKKYRLNVINALIMFITDLFLQPIFIIRIISSIVMAGALVDVVVVLNLIVSLFIAMLPAGVYVFGHLYFMFHVGLLIAINLIF